MPNSNYVQQVLAIYDDKRTVRESNAVTALNQLLKQSPELRKARDHYSAIRMQSVREKDVPQDVVQSAYQAYQDALFKACDVQKVPVEQIQPHPDCSLCNDTGYIGEEEKRYCSCLLNRVAQLAIENQNLVEEFTFDNFDLNVFPDDEIVDRQNNTQRSYMKLLMKRLMTWCDEFPRSESRQILMCGQTGVGKTYLLNCIAHRMIQRGTSTILTTADAINEATLNSIRERDNSVVNMMKTTELLLIDDLGSEAMLKNITVETLYRLIEHRLTAGLHTIISSNLTVNAIQDRYGYRVYSRIAPTGKNTMGIMLKGVDLRRKG